MMREVVGLRRRNDRKETSNDREGKTDRIQGPDRGVEVEVEVGRIITTITIAITREEDNKRENVSKNGCLLFVRLKCFNSMELLLPLTSSVCRRAFLGIAGYTGRKVKDSV